MKTIFRVLILLALLFGAFSFYSYGNATGMFIFILLGVAFEGAFWFNLFPGKKKKASSE